MNQQDIDALLAQKGKPCISITVPTTKYTRERMQNPELIEKAIDKAKQLLTHTAWPEEQTAILHHKLDSLKDNIDYMRLQEGLAIFISTDSFKIQLLPFTVSEKVILAGNFEIRDLIYFNQFLEPYYLLAISKKRIRLFKGCGRDLQEVINSDFPRKYVEEYEYSRPSVGSSSSSGLKSFERDKSVMQEARTKDFFRHADDAVSKYVKGDICLFVVGVEEQLADFDRISHHLNNIGGRIRGNFDVDAVHPLAQTCWNLIKEEVRTSQRKLLAKLEEDIGTGLAIDGIKSVWYAAQQSKGLMLLVEKNYEIRGYVQPDYPDHIYLFPPVGNHILVPDVADEIIRTVLEKGGGIQMVENGDLAGHDRIAMLLRY